MLEPEYNLDLARRGADLNCLKGVSRSLVCCSARQLI
jgi:hypothetical protein